MHKDLVNQELIDIMQEFVAHRLRNRQAVRDEPAFSAGHPSSDTYTIPEEGRSPSGVVSELVGDILTDGARTEHPRFFGFIPGPAAIASWIGDALSSASNLHGAAIANAPSALAAERATLQWLIGLVGYGSRGGGDFVSGGSIANLTALTAARDKMLDPADWARATAYISVETHSSIVRALKVIGVTEDRIRRICVDEDFRMIPEDLVSAITTDRLDGYAPFTVIATAGTTNTGAIDPLGALADIASAESLWLHVDGAFGASALVSETHRGMLQGVERSDSISWDAHKWLFQTYGLGVVLVRDRVDLLRSFHVDPEYLQDVKGADVQPNPCDLGIELTRPTRGLRLWFTLQVYGREALGAWIDHGFDMAERFQAKISALPHWEIVSDASLAITTFRFSPPGVSEQHLDALNQEISSRSLADGFCALYTTVMHGRKTLRLATTNPDTTRTDIDQTVRRLDGFAQVALHDLLKRPTPPDPRDEAIDHV
ncbi:MAG: pyridoxal phosphate-dependent decarboxylase family protein [Brachybacterium sp.]